MRVGSPLCPHPPSYATTAMSDWARFGYGDSGLCTFCDFVVAFYSLDRQHP
jgi:hypothetical protein